MSPSRSAGVILMVVLVAFAGPTIGHAWRATPQTQAMSAATPTTHDDVLESCPVTKPPGHPFVPPSPYPTLLDPGSFWFGTEKLWTVLHSDGTWKGLPHYRPTDTAFRQKLFWWRKGFDGRKVPLPMLKITGKRLDSPAPSLEVNGQANASWTNDQEHPFIVSGIDIPTLGCWEITGRLEDAELSFVVWVTPK